MKEGPLMKILEDSKLFLRNHGPGFSHNEGGRERERGKGGREVLMYL